jgi:hypothetical protein
MGLPMELRLAPLGLASTIFVEDDIAPARREHYCSGLKIIREVAVCHIEKRICKGAGREIATGDHHEGRLGTGLGSNGSTVVSRNALWILTC